MAGHLRFGEWQDISKVSSQRRVARHLRFGEWLGLHQGLAQAVLDPERGTAVYHTQPPASIHDKSAPTAIVTATSSIRRSIIPKDLLERTRGKVHVAENLVEPEVHGRPDALQGSLRAQVQGAAAERFPTDRRASHAGHLRRVSCCGCRIALESLLERRVAGHLRGWRGWRGAVLCQASGVFCFFSTNTPGNAVTGGTQCSQGANTALTAPSWRRGTARHHNTAFPAPAHDVVDLSARL